MELDIFTMHVGIEHNLIGAYLRHHSIYINIFREEYLPGNAQRKFMNHSIDS